MIQEKFYMVQGGGPSTYKHENFESAANEAKRLARLNPDQNFIVMESVAGFIKREVEEIEFICDFGEDEIPF